MIIVRPLQPLNEYVHLCTRIASQLTVDVMVQTMSAKYGFDPAQIESLLQPIGTIEKVLIEQINTQDADFTLLYHHDPQQFMSIGQALVLLLNGEERIPSLTDEQWRKFLTMVIHNPLGSNDAQLPEPIPQLSDLTKSIIDSDYEASIKYNLMVLLNRPKELLENLLRGYLAFKEHLIPHLDHMNTIAQKALAPYIQADIDAFIKTVQTDLNVRDVPVFDPLTIQPTFFNYNVLSFMDEPWDMDLSENVIWYLGIELLPITDLLKASGDQKQRVQSVLKTLSDPSKLELLKLCAKQAQYGVPLAKELGLTTATVSYHLNALVRLGYLTMSLDGNKVYYVTQNDRIISDLQAVQALFNEKSSG
jgi:DNA-binding transcriptional ArsR family regulator